MWVSNDHVLRVGWSVVWCACLLHFFSLDDYDDDEDVWRLLCFESFIPFEMGHGMYGVFLGGVWMGGHVLHRMGGRQFLAGQCV